MAGFWFFVLASRGIVTNIFRLVTNFCPALIHKLSPLYVVIRIPLSNRPDIKLTFILKLFRQPFRRLFLRELSRARYLAFC